MTDADRIASLDTQVECLLANVEALQAAIVALDAEFDQRVDAAIKAAQQERRL